MELTSKNSASQYSPNEERVNIISHAIGFAVGVVALFALLTKAFFAHVPPLYFFSLSIYLVSFCVLYAASTAYHYAKTNHLRSRLKVLDHCAIFVFIAGTYTPFSLIVLQGHIGWSIVAISWLLAACGIGIKLFFIQKVGKAVSASMYIAMGWLVLFVIKPLIQNLPENGLLWLLAGGIFYTIGGVLYAIKVIPFNHAIFHIFTLVASVCHLITAWFYLF